MSHLEPLTHEAATDLLSEVHGASIVLRNVLKRVEAAGIIEEQRWDIPSALHEVWRLVNAEVERLKEIKGRAAEAFEKACEAGIIAEEATGWVLTTSDDEPLATEQRHATGVTIWVSLDPVEAR